jgi:NADPH-dependent 2,4-dienoyl-CoA reductase/sulfur reductase-like enzyme/bacterioferritin-associated ferredoxin
MTTLANRNAPDKRVGGLPQDADVIIIGAGPAGMSAAIELASAGCKIIVIDLQAEPGGQIFRALETNLAARPATDKLLAALGPGYRAGQALIEQFRASPGINFRPETTVWDIRADGTVGWLAGEAAGYLRARHIILANGAMERPAPFPGWTLPGVMTAGAIQTLIKAGRLQPEGKIVLVGTGPLMFLLADQLRRLGVRPQLIARTDRFQDKIRAMVHLRFAGIPALLKGLGWLMQLRLAGIPMQSGVTDIKANGETRVESVNITIAGKTVEHACDLLVVHDGIVPSIDLAHGAALELEWRKADKSWRPKTTPDGQTGMVSGAALTPGPSRIRVAGDARAIGGGDAAIAHGRLVAKAVLTALHNESTNAAAKSSKQATASLANAMAARPFIEAAFPVGLAAQLPDDSVIVCRCEEITAGSIRASIREGAGDINQIRGLLRCGMGACQGRSCSITLARILADIDPNAVTNPAPFRARPPLRPLPLKALAALTGVDPGLAKVVSLDDKPQAAHEDDNHA